MKYIITSLLSVLFSVSAFAAEKPKTKTPPPPSDVVYIPDHYIDTSKVSNPLSLEPVAVFRSDLDGNWDHGVGLSLGYNFNSTFSAQARAVAYSNEDWEGKAIDEVSLLGKAAFFNSKNGLIELSAIGGGDYDSKHSDIGLSAGARGDLNLSKSASLFIEGRGRLWRDGEADSVLGAGLRFRF